MAQNDNGWAVPEGFVLVPMELNEEMVGEAGSYEMLYSMATDIYRAMLAARPTPPPCPDGWQPIETAPIGTFAPRDDSGLPPMDMDRRTEFEFRSARSIEAERLAGKTAETAGHERVTITDEAVELLARAISPGWFYEPMRNGESVVSNYPGQTARMQELARRSARELLPALLSALALPAPPVKEGE